MNQTVDQPRWFRYIETPRGKSSPVKLDRILEERMKEFLAAKNAKMANS